MKSLAIGAVLWDIIGDAEYIGGTSFNLTAHLAQLGCNAALLTCVGKDERGQKAKKAMRELGVNTRFVYEHASLPTGIASVSLDDNGMPAYKLPYSAYDEIYWSGEVLEKIKDFAPDVLCVGTHEQREIHNQQIWKDLCKAVKVPYVYYDVNLRLGYNPQNIIQELIDRANILKLNDEEVESLSKVFWNCSKTPEEFCRCITKEFDLYCIVVTLGGNGCLVWHEGELTRLPGYRAKVVNTVGCGDAFSAGFLTMLFQTGNPLLAADRGNILGAYVASSEQAVPRYSREIFDEERKICNG